MANTFKFGNGNWAVKDGAALAYNDQNGNFKPLPFDFTRGSSATRINKQGLIENVPSDKPRIDFFNNTNGHLLLEPSRENKFPYSNQSSAPALNTFSAGTSTISITNDYGISPDGTQNAMRFQATCGSTLTDRAGLRDLLSMSATDATLSFYGKSNTGSNQTIAFHFIGGTKTVVTLTNEWQRFEYTETSNTSNYAGVEIRGTYTDQDVDVLLFGFQMEQASYATSYIPTEGSTVTRSADAANSAGNNQVFDNDTGVWFIDLERIGIQSGRAMMLANSSGSEQIRLHFDAPTEQIRFRDNKNGLATIGGNISMGASTRKKVALKIDGTTLKVFADGSQVGSNYTRPTAFDIHLMYAAEDAFKLFDTRFYNTALSDSDLQALTS